MTTYTYEFTAFTEDALLSAGSGNGTNLGYGDSFTMPASADVTFAVTDNDPYLSGDSWNNENANDSSYQTATITIDGEEAGNGGQVYGEQYFWVWGSSGNWYLMIEIEQEGTGDDYFTFYNAYGVPEEGETLTVSCGGNIDCWQPHMGCLEGPAASIPPVAVLDEITITEGDSIGDGDDDAQLNILANDFDTDGTISLTGVNGAQPGDVVTVTTDRGVVVDVTVDVNGNLFFDSASDFDSLRVGETDSFQLTYTITDDDGNNATSTVTVTIEGETTVDAVDDVITVLESEGAGDLETLDSGAASVLANDMIDGEAYSGLVVTVNGQTGNVGQWIDLDKGRVKLNADGTIDFDADGDFDALNDGESEAVELNYTISAVEAGPDEYQCLFFNHLATGEIITDQFASAGLTISSANAANPVMIFDSANPTGGDFDLATSNLGKVLILSEDGSSANPDDNAGGGTFIFDFERAADIDSITMLDTEEPAPQIRLYGEDGMLLNTITGPVTADGGQGVAQINTAGVFRMEIELQGSGALDNLIYTIDGPTTVVDQDTATVTINVLGEDAANGNLPPDAVDDFFSTVETTPITGNVLTNDSDPENDPISVIAVEGGEVGGEIAVTTSKGNTGIVTVGEDGAFTFTPDDSFISLAEDEVDTFDLTYTITDDPSTAAKTNLLFVLDVSNSTVGLNGQNVFDGAGVGDVNSDGRADTVLDAEIQAVISSVNKLLAQGIDPSMVDIGLVTFSGLVDLSRFAAPFNTPTADAETIGGAGTVYQLDSAAVISALQNIMSGGWTNYEAGLQEAEGWLAANADDGEANKVIFLSDGRPIIDYVNGAYVSQDNSDYGDEVTRIVNNYSADIAAIGVGANSSLEALDELDNTGGAEQVLDVETLTIAVEDAVLLPLTDTATITVTITGVNDLSDGSETAEVDEGSGLTVLAVNALSNADDPDGGTPIVTPIIDANGANGGVFSIDASGQITFDTNDDFDYLAEGETTTTAVNYTVTDGQGGEVQSSVTITVNGVNSLDDDDEAASVDEGSGVTVLAVNALDNVNDPDGGTPVVTPISGVAGSNGGLFSIDAAGQITFDTNNDFNTLGLGDTETTTVTYTVTDGQGGEVQSNVTITVNGVNDLDDGSETASVFEDAAPTQLDNALLNTVDPDSDPANIMIATLAGVALVAGAATADGTGGGSFTFLEDGTVTFSTDGDFDFLTPGQVTTTSVSYQVTDGDGGLVTSTYTVEVTGVNDAPVAVANSYAIIEGQALTGANIIIDPDPTSDTGEADSDPNGDALVINSALGKDVDGNLTVDIVSNDFVTVYTDGGVTVEVKLDAAGNLEVSENSDVGPDGDQISLEYTVEDIPANGDAKISNTANVSVTIADVPNQNEGPEINVVFLLDASRSAVLGQSDFGDEGSQFENADVNGDGQVGSHFDGSLTLMQSMINAFQNELGANGNDVEIGVYAFEGENPEGTNALNDNGQTVFGLDTDYASIINNYPVGAKFGTNDVPLEENGNAFFAPAMTAANTFFTVNNQSGSDAINLVYVLSESLGTESPAANLVSALTNTFFGSNDPANPAPDYGRPLVDTIYFAEDGASTLPSNLALLELFGSGPGDTLGDGVTNIVNNQLSVDNLLLTIADPLGDLVDEALGVTEELI